jgi:hypothetical protein
MFTFIFDKNNYIKNITKEMKYYIGIVVDHKHARMLYKSFLCVKNYEHGNSVKL